MSSSSLLISKLARIASLTDKKLRYENSLSSEYEKLEQVGPAPGRPWEQHDTMVSIVHTFIIFFLCKKNLGQK